ncbi:biliverdin reductase A isoform X1 [Ornithorhynchus anatinus]|uniref:Biliverdin reductase A n=2 Tax=Ornithorhynchus anatinus TaxID=9258 RepID=F6T8F5_ORNAN|nr:biliverdin reductase A isoform X1 [Ornithorhynchus anatinus]
MKGVRAARPFFQLGHHQASRMPGVVVVGVGRAGSVRIRDLQNSQPGTPSEHLKLLGFVSRRELGSINGVKQIALKDALEDKEVDVAFICSENSSHEENIRQFLEAGKHVLVEYPMALSHVAAQELWKLAEQKGKILHEEHIELLTEEYISLKKEVSGKELVKGTLHFTAGPLDEERFGFPSFSGISRLSWLVDLFGELSLVSATMEEQKDKKYLKMTADLKTADQRPLTWIEEKGPDLKREKHIKFSFTSGCLENLPAAPGGNVGIFMKDQNLFAQKVLGQVSEDDLTAEKRRVLHCLEIAAEIQKLCSRPKK